MLQFVGRVVIGTTKFGIKHVIIPIVISAVTAAVASAVAERIREKTPQPLITPQP